MKTLNEVIKAIEWCTELDQSGCGACPYVDDADNRCYADDALHYLKEYRAEKANLEIIKGNYQDAVANCEKAENKFKSRLKALNIGTLNEPLTWEELKGMEGKPVWVHLFGSGLGEWNLIHAQLDNQIWFADGNGYIYDMHAEKLGKTWQAYRKEWK